MRFARANSKFSRIIGSIFPLVLLLGAVDANGACNRTITSVDAIGYYGVPFSYPITVSGGSPQSYNAAGLPPGLTVDTSTGLISGTPTAIGTYPVTLSATYNSGGCTTITENVTFTISLPPASTFVGFRLPDYLMSSGTPNNPRLMLQMGANGATTTANRFNATLEVNGLGFRSDADACAVYQCSTDRIAACCLYEGRPALHPVWHFPDGHSLDDGKVKDNPAPLAKPNRLSNGDNSAEWLWRSGRHRLAWSCRACAQSLSCRVRLLPSDILNQQFHHGCA